MPRWLRQFTFNKINDFYIKEAEEIEAAKNNKSGRTTLIDPSGNINKENWKGLPQGSNTSTQNKKISYK